MIGAHVWEAERYRSRGGLSNVVGRMVYEIDDYVNPSEGSLRQQWTLLHQRKAPAPGSRQVPFIPIETVLCLCASLVIDHKKFGSGSAHRAGPVVQSLARIFHRPPTSILAKMANLDGTRNNGAKYDRVVGKELSDVDRLGALYRRIIVAGREAGFKPRTLPDFLRLEKSLSDKFNLDVPPRGEAVAGTGRTGVRAQAVSLSPDERLRESLVEALSVASGGLTKYDLARSMPVRATRSDINKVLYRHPEVFQSDSATPPRWTLVNAAERHMQSKHKNVEVSRVEKKPFSDRGVGLERPDSRSADSVKVLIGPQEVGGAGRIPAQTVLGISSEQSRKSERTLIDDVLALLGPSSTVPDVDPQAPVRDNLLNSEEVRIFALYKGVRTDALFFPKSRGVRIETGPLAGKAFATPSGAANALIATRTPGVSPTTNGWSFWSLEDGTGRKLGALKSALERQ